MTDHPVETFAPSTTVTFAAGLPFSLQSQIQLALTEMDLLYRVPKRVHVNVVQNAKRREQGSYDPQAIRIAISRYAMDPLGTFIHEYGHFLDNRILHPLRNEYASRYDLDFDPLMKACWRSHSIRDIGNLLNLHRRHLSRAEILFLKEAYEPYEVFARAYAQWVCTRSLSFMLHASLQRRLQATMLFSGRFVRLQWEPADFADIMIEMERTFHKKGLI